jgi:hypothetical protein
MTLEKFKKIPLTQKQQDLLDLGNEFLSFHEHQILPRLKEYFDQNIKPLVDSNGIPVGEIPFEVQKAYHVINSNQKLWILIKSVQLLTIWGFGDQGNSLCRTMFETWFDSQYVILSVNPNVIQKIENWGRIQGCQHFKEIAEFDKKWAIKLKNDWKKELENLGKTLEEEIQEIEDLKKNLYKDKSGRISHWSGVEEKKRWKLIKTGNAYEGLKRGYLTIYKSGSQSVHGSNFWIPPLFPSLDKLRSQALAGSFLCFYGQTEDLQNFLNLGLDDNFNEFYKKNSTKFRSVE